MVCLQGNRVAFSSEMNFLQSCSLNGFAYATQVARNEIWLLMPLIMPLIYRLFHGSLMTFSMT